MDTDSEAQSEEFDRHLKVANEALDPETAEEHLEVALGILIKKARQLRDQQLLSRANKQSANN